MLTLMIGLLTAAAAWFGLHLAWPGHPVWNSVAALFGFLGVGLLINLQVKKRLEAIFGEVQNSIMETQEHLRRKITVLQNKMQGGPRIQAMVEKEQAEAIMKSIQILDKVTPLKKWNLLAVRQANTLRGQLLFQIKDFAGADPYLDKAIIMDPLTQAMRMTRLYKRGRMEEVTKAFQKGIRRFKDEKATIIYALYSWILVEEGRIDEAVSTLFEAKSRTENDVLRQNWEHLANGRVKRFSNAGLGEEWYALHLEVPKTPRIRQQGAFGGPGLRHFR
ncbi:MAG: hypothetical protein PHC30_07400 [Lentisphaeria bacterium]|jgi:tetratricopeptide (TPR) repeat protein|nr:hypothetical protein [Lentisphaeria bacterium]